MTLVFAVSYGGRQEIKQAVQEIAAAIEKGAATSNDVTEEMISRYLDSSFLPDPDLVIRTSGESRLSNFFLWQAAYSELYICDQLWPDFSVEDFDRSLDYFSSRERRFGKTSAQVVVQESPSSSANNEAESYSQEKLQMQ